MVSPLNPNKSRPRPQVPQVPRQDRDFSAELIEAFKILDENSDGSWGRFRQGDDGGTTFRCHLGPNFPRDFSQFCWMLMMLRGKSTIFAESSGFQRCKKLGISLAWEVRSIFHLWGISAPSAPKRLCDEHPSIQVAISGLTGLLAAY